MVVTLSLTRGTESEELQIKTLEMHFCLNLTFKMDSDCDYLVIKED